MKEMIRFINKKKMFIVFGLSILQSSLAYATSFFISHFATNPLTITKLRKLLIILLLLYVALPIINYFFICCSQTFLYGINYDAKNYFYKKLQTIDPQNLTKYHSGYIQSTIERTAEDYTIVLENIVYDFIPLLIGLCSFIYMACTQSVLLGFICISIFALAFTIRVILQRKREPLRGIMFKKMSSYNGSLVDFIQNISTVVKLNAENFTNEKLVVKEQDFLQSLQKTEDMTAVINALFKLLTNSIYIFVIIFCIRMLKNGEDALPYLLFYISVIGRVSDNLATCSKRLERFFFIPNKQTTIR